MMKLDPTFSSFIEIDSHALHTATGGVPPPGAGGWISAAKKTGKGKGIVAGGMCLLGCLIGPHHPGPEIDLGGSIVGKPQGRPPAGAPPFPGSGPKPVPVPGGGEIIIPE